jgi:8-oxo-dGTP pyrophosphatase MutT (NUDIX family)
MTDFYHIQSYLRFALSNSLPGEKAHRLLLPEGRKLKPVTSDLSVNQSGVLLTLFPDNEQLYTCFIRRPETMKNHAGQISFPGGRQEDKDPDLIATALRESQEEVGVIPSNVDILGRLSPLYVPVSNFFISPVVGWSESKPDFQINHTEVDDLILVPVAELMAPDAIQTTQIEMRNGPREVPCFRFNGHIIWGATAMIFSEFREILKQMPVRTP